MIQHKITAYALVTPDGGGYRDEVVGHVATIRLAKEWVAASPNWPRSYKKTTLTVKIAETADEIRHSTI